MSAEADRTALRILASQFEQAATTKPKLYHQRITLPLVVDHRVLDQWQKIAMSAIDGGTCHVAFRWTDHCRQCVPDGCRLIEVAEACRSQQGKAYEYDAYFGEAGAKESLAHFRRLVATIPVNLQPWIDRLYQLAAESPSAALRIGLETLPFGLHCRLERPGQPDEYQLLQPACRRGLAGDLFASSAVGLVAEEHDPGALALSAEGPKRACYKRDYQWLRWSMSGQKPAAIRDRWNKEHPEDSVGEGEDGRDLVKKGIAKAKKETGE